MQARGLLRLFGVLFCVLAVSNLSKPFEMESNVGFVFFGKRLHGTPNLVIAPLFGLYLFVYGIGVLRLRRWALPMGIAYAVYVALNVGLFAVRMPEEALRNVAFGVAYMVVAVGVSAASAWLLYRERAALT